MAVNRLSNARIQYDDGNGALASNYRLFFYAAGSSTKQNTYNSSAGSVANSNPIVLNALGEPGVEIWLTAGQSYKLGIAIPGTDDPPASFVWTEDVISGVNDTTSAVDEWKASQLTPTFVSATSFTLVGDQTTEFHVGRRLKTTNSGGTVYSTITTSSFGAGITTVTVANDSGTLDAGLSAVSYGIVRSINTSLPGLINVADVPTLSVAGTVRGASPANEPINLSLAFSVGGSALTIAIKGRNGADPSASNPVLIPFRNATAATGDYSWLVLTSAISLVISSGSTLGIANSTPFRVWIAAFNDAGTVRLGAILCTTLASGTLTQYPLSGWGIASSTAEGGAGAADSAQTFYTGTSVTSKAYTVLGYATWEGGLATAGTWSSAPTRAQLNVPGMPLPGQTVQVARTQTGAVNTGSTAIPVDDTIPQITEGDEYMTRAITPSSAANLLQIASLAHLSHSANGNLTSALFQDATANALAASRENAGGTVFVVGIPLEHWMLAGTTSSTTMRIRLGSNGAGTTTFNGASSTREDGGVLASMLRVEEVMA